MSKTQTANVELCIKAQTQLLGTGRLELAEALISPACVDHGGPTQAQGGDGARGPEAIKGIVRWLRGAFPDLSYEIEDAFGDGDRVVLRCVARGTHRGEFMGASPTGRGFAVQQIHIFRIEDGQIAEHWACRDDVAMMRQLGLAG